MTNEEFEKTKKFILEQQARFAVGMKELREAQATTEHVVAQAGLAVTHSRETVARLVNGTREGFKNERAKINTVIDSQIQTAEDLRKLILFLNRYSRRRRNRN